VWDNENKNRMYQNLLTQWNQKHCSEANLCFSRPVKKRMISSHQKEKSKHKASKRKEMIKIMAEINEVENRKRREKLVTQNIHSLTKTNKLDKALVRLQRRNVEDSCYNI
jgi:hypothetical protein